MTGNKTDDSARTLGMTGTKWEIFVSAVNLFSKNGYSNVSISDITSALNIKPASMYNYFGSKDELLSEIYSFCQQHFDNITNNIDNLSALVPTTPPHQIFEKYLSFFGDEIYGLGLYELMPKILKIILQASNHDKRARKLITILYYDYPQIYLKPIIQQLLDEDGIEPIDIDLFLVLYCSLELSSSQTHGSQLAPTGEAWKKSRTLLFSLIQEKY